MRIFLGRRSPGGLATSGVHMTKLWACGLASHVFLTFFSPSPPGLSFSLFPSLPVSPLPPSAMISTVTSRTALDVRGTGPWFSTHLEHTSVSFNFPKGNAILHVLHRIKLATYPLLFGRTLNTGSKGHIEDKAFIPETSCSAAAAAALTCDTPAPRALCLRNVTHVTVAI